MLIDFKNQTTSQKYNLMASAVIPRPIAWIATQGEVLNIAPFSYFTPLSSKPPTFIISIGHKRDGSPKDTLRNLRDSKVCTISIIEEDHLGDMNLSLKNISFELDAIARVGRNYKKLEKKLFLDNFIKNSLEK